MKNPTSHCATLAFVLALGFTATAPAAEFGRASPHPEEREAVIMQLPADRSAPGAATWNDGGRGRPIQSLADGSRLVIVPRIPAGVPLALRSSDTPAARGSAGTGPRFRRDRDTLVAQVRGHDLFGFNFGTIQPPRPDIDPIYARSGYIDPIRTRAGAVISEAFGRLPPQHEHQYGMWSAWFACTFEGREINFWAVRAGTTQVRCEGVSDVWEGPVAAGFTAVNVFYDRTVTPEKAALRETWKVAAYNVPEDSKYDLFDVALSQVCASASPVLVKRNSYGGFAMHLPDSLYGDGTRFMVSTGETDRAKANQNALRWIYMGGLFDGRQAGLAVLAHPTNFRAPEPVRLHPQTAYFSFSPASPGDFEIAPGRPYHARYRIVVFDGPPDRERLERLWHAFASVPPLALP